MGEYMGLTPRKRDQDEVAPAFGHFLCCPGAFIWEPCTPARQPTSTWSSSRRAATTKQHRNWNCRCSWHSWLCWRPAPSSARCQCSWWPLWKIMHPGLVPQLVSNFVGGDELEHQCISSVPLLLPVTSYQYQLPGPQYHCCYQFIHTK